MSRPNPKHKSQKQNNLVKKNTVGGNLIFAPQQIDTYIETQIVEISVDKITHQPLIKTSPYKGIKRFNLGDREYFFGRDALIAKLFNAVNESSFSLVLGASGSGKSSIVRAGLIPELKKSLESQKFYDFIFTPNQDPFESLYRCLLSEEKDYRFSESDVDFVREGKDNTLPQLISKLKKNEERWFIFIDQFEQLFLNIDPKKLNSFIKGITQVAKKGDSSVRIVLAMRSDFLEQFSFYKTLGEIANKNNIHLVTEMYPDELRQAIEQPAAKNGVVFEKGLVKQIINEVEGQKGYLPLLQYTLDLLWQKECTTKAADGCFHIEDRTLNKASYTDLGGVRGALQKRVDEIYTGICEKNENGELITKQIFLKLVNIVESESGSRAVSRRAYYNEFVGESVKNTLKTFVNENLLVSNYEYSNQEQLSIGTPKKLTQNVTIEIAHEILLSSWNKLKSWLEEEKEAIILKNWLATEERRWSKVREENKSKASEELLKGSRLDQILEFRDKNAFEKLGGLTEKENQFIDASVGLRDREYKQHERRKLFTISGLTFVAVISLIVTGILWWRLDINKKNADLIIQNINLEELWLSNAPQLQALTVGIEIGKEIKKESKATPETRMRVAALLREIVYGIKEHNSLEKHNNWVTSVAFSPDGKTIASASRDSTVKLWNLQGQVMQTLTGHVKGLTSVAFSPDGKTIATASWDSTIKLWNLQGQVIQTLTGHGEGVTSIVFSPDGNTIASASADSTVKLWNLQGQVIQTLKGHQETVNSVAFSPDGNTIATASWDNTIKLWNLQGQVIQTLTGHIDWVRSITFSPDGNTIATVSNDNTVKLWNLQGQVIQTLTGHSDSVISIAFSPDGNTIATGSMDKTVKLWNLQGQVIQTLKGHGKQVFSIAFSPNSNTIATANADKTVKLWNLQGQVIQTLTGHSDPVISVAFSSNSNTIATTDTDYTIKLWNLQGQVIQTLTEHSDSVISVAFNPNSDTIATANADDTIKLWNLQGQVIQTLTGHGKQVFNIVFSPDGNTIATASRDNTIKLWNLQRQTIKTLTGHGEEVNSITFSPNGKTIATANAETVKLWNLQGKVIQTLTGHSKQVFSIIFSPDGNTIATASRDKTVKLWNLHGQEIKTLTGHSEKINSIAFSRDGKTIATASKDKTVKLWNLQGQMIKALRGHSEGINSVVFSLDGKTIATASDDKTVKLWNLQGQAIRTLTGHDKAIASVTFSSNGKTIASASYDKTVKLWNFDLDDLLVQGCNWARDYLKNNPNVSEEDKNLCDDIGNKK
ncbi:NACHT and WD repeat domain-containing protein [Mastigocoleus testarum]|uniref:Novel STAND NTPase 1 domain-containing protein n=2 Tax=Mastigocoleus TaxID=996924 RepID=A0A0V7ZG58_9CYAN|nr:WD40 repeat domain-containing protein [Mastigocoleus testarum]KST63552.1 hypothetical protein BC008_13895 [Mastigocoleus testarum BC008]